MRRLHFFLFLILFAFFAVVISAEEWSFAGSPRLVIEEKEHDFGTVDEGTVLTYSFKVKNKGDIPLKITRVRPG